MVAETLIQNLIRICGAGLRRVSSNSRDFRMYSIEGIKAMRVVRRRKAEEATPIAPPKGVVAEPKARRVVKRRVEAEAPPIVAEVVKRPRGRPPKVKALPVVLPPLQEETEDEAAEASVNVFKKRSKKKKRKKSAAKKKAAAAVKAAAVKKPVKEVRVVKAKVVKAKVKAKVRAKAKAKAAYKTGQNAGPLELTVEDFNEKELAVLEALNGSGRGPRLEMGLNALATQVFPEASDNKGTSWVRNSLRRLVRSGYVEKTGRGAYCVADTGRKRLAKAA